MSLPINLQMELLYLHLFEFLTALTGSYFPVGSISGRGIGSQSTFPPSVPAVFIYGYSKPFELADFRGDVGCGKTMLMDMLYDTLPATTNKTRVHFHAFMLDIHKSLSHLPHPLQSYSPTILSIFPVHQLTCT